MATLDPVSLLAILGFAPSLLSFLGLQDDRTRYSILVNAAVSALGYAATKAVIPLIKARTLRAGLHGKDINKKGSEAGEKNIPESLGLAPGVVFLVSCLWPCACTDASKWIPLCTYLTLLPLCADMHCIV